MPQYCTPHSVCPHNNYWQIPVSPENLAPAHTLRAHSAPRNCPRILCNLEIHLISKNLKTRTVLCLFWRLVLGSIFGNSWLLLGMASSHSYFCFLILATFSHACSHSLLRVSALHYSAGDQFSEGFQTVASARALRQPTSCGSEYFYNQCPQVRNLIGTERSLNRSECRVKKEAS